MAGVGFELNRILARKGYAATLQAYTYAGLIGSGPWLIAVLSLGALGTLIGATTSHQDSRILFVSISFIYSITLVGTGPLQMLLTRFAADQMFARQTHRIFPTFVATLAWAALGFTLLGLLLFVGFVPGPLVFRLGAAFLTTLVASIWITGIFLTALKNYRAVLVAFAAGFATSLGAAWTGAHLAGLPGAMLGVATGHLVLLLILLGVVFVELGNFELEAPGFAAYARRYWDLALGGLLYNLSILADKFVYWWIDPAAEPVAGILHASPIFDRVVYFSFLTIVPGMAVFLLKLETDFALKNTLFFDHVLKKGTLGQILDFKRQMIESLHANFNLLLKVQGTVTLTLVLGAGTLLDLLGIGAVQAGVLQISLIGVFLLVLFLAFLTVLYYLDKRRDAMGCCLAFALINGFVSIPCAFGGDRYYGIGFLLGAATATAIAALRVNTHLQQLDYDTFTSQPLYG